MNQMFYKCLPLIDIMLNKCKPSDSSNFTTPNITNSLKLNINKINNMHDMLNGCNTLILPSSKWNTNNVTDMSEIFYNCESLSSLPDISKFNTNNIIDMYNCGSLMSLPKILHFLKEIYIGFFINIKNINPN
jgi:surface protein